MLRQRADGRPVRLPAWWPVLALIAVALAAGVLAALAGWRLGPDSAVYRAGARALLNGEPLYNYEPLSTLPPWVLLPFTYTPAAALLFLPLAVIPVGLTWGVVGTASVLCLAVTVWLCLRPVLAKVSAKVSTRWWLVAGVTVAGLAFEPVWKTVLLGQVNIILMALILLDLLVICAWPGEHRGRRWGGVLVGIAAAIKLTPLIFVPHLVFTGRWRDAVRATATFVVLQGAMFTVIPNDATRYWTAAATDPERVGSVHWIFNQSLHGLISRAAADASWSMSLALGIGVVLAVPAVWLVVRLHRRGEALAAILVTAFFGLLVSPVSWTHHWVWVVPLVLLLVSKRRFGWAALVTLVFVSCVVMLVPNGADIEFRWGVTENVLGNSYVVCAAIGLVGLAAREFWLLRQTSAVRRSTGHIG